MIKLNFDDFMDAGEELVFGDAIEVCKGLDELGIDLMEVSATNESSGKGLAPAITRIVRPLKKLLCQWGGICVCKKDLLFPATAKRRSFPVKKMCQALQASQIGCYRRFKCPSSPGKKEDIQDRLELARGNLSKLLKLLLLF